MISENIEEYPPSELNNLGRKYENMGIYSVTIKIYERCLHLGILSKVNYLRLAVIYIRRGDLFNKERILARYRSMEGIKK